MPLYAIIAKDKPNGLAHRQAVRPEHLEHLDKLGSKLVLAGPFQDESGNATGSFMVIEAVDIDEARATFEQDPFVARGVFSSWDISRWHLGINKSEGR